MKNYSVLMSVSNKESAQNLKESIDSIFNQTIPTNDFVLICDGPINPELDCVIEQAKTIFGDTLRVVRLPENLGLGNALRIGLNMCHNSLVARMDSDDISRKERCELQLEIFERNPDLSFCSGMVEEFVVDTSNVTSRRIVPETNSGILEFAKKRNPVNHPCVMFRKEDVLSAGSYQDFYLLEDYYLWIRMLVMGFKGYNIQKPILWMRTSEETYKRRSGKKYVQSQKTLFRYMYHVGFITKAEYIEARWIRTTVSFATNRTREIIYHRFLRKSA